MKPLLITHLRGLLHPLAITAWLALDRCALTHARGGTLEGAPRAERADDKDERGELPRARRQMQAVCRRLRIHRRPSLLHLPWHTPRSDGAELVREVGVDEALAALDRMKNPASAHSVVAGSRGRDGREARRCRQPTPPHTSVTDRVCVHA